ncbi:DUF7010 family protein [Paraglaciecola aestuariivivens]
MQFKQAQHNMHISYLGGATGVLVSGLVWCIAGLVGLFFSAQASMLTLFFGGMLIFPLSILLAKLFKRSGKHSKDNPLGKLAIESTIILFVGLFIAFTVASIYVAWFYPIMLLMIGVRYLIFTTLYGSKIYWALGASLMLVGALCIVLNAEFATGAVLGGVIELIFALLIFNQGRQLTTAS